MRKIFSTVMLVAAAAMTFVSCQKEENRAPETVSATLTMHAGVDQTKTYLDENNTVLWGENEVVKLYVGSGETAKFFDSESTDNDGKASASFTFEIKDVNEADTYALGGIYPALAVQGINNNDNPKSYKVALPATQKAEPGKYDPSAYIMVLKPEAVKELPTEYQASFRRAVALNKITLTNVPEDVTMVEITAPNNKYLAGRRYMNLTTGESGEIYDSGSQTNVVKVNGDFKAGSFDVWFCSWGVELSENDPLTVKMTSANNIYTHTINARAEGIKFVEGDLNTLKINMEHAVSMGSTPLPFTADFSGKTATGAFTELEGFEKVEGYVCNASGAIRLAKSGEGGSITTPLLDLSKNFYVRVFASGWNADELTLTVSAGDQSEDVALSAVSNGNSGPGECAEHIVNFQPVSNSASVKFAAANGKRCYIKQIEICEGHAVPAPVLKATGTEEMAATGGEGSFTVTIINPIEGKEVGATVDADWIDIVVDGNQVTYTVAENTSEERREAVITLSYENAQSVDVVITQDAKPAEGVAQEVTDVLTQTTTGVTGTSYSIWSGKTVTSTAVYAGQSAGGNSSIQLRTKNSNSGVVTTNSGGKVTKVKVTWNSSTTGDRSLDVYGKNSAYTQATDLYDNSLAGTKLGSIKYGESIELEIAGDYQYIGLRSADGALYLTDISITWSSASGSGGETPAPEEPETPDNPTPDPEPEPETPTVNGYVRVTDLNSLTTGSYVVVAKVNNTYYAMSNSFSSKINGASVNVSNDVISASDASSYIVTVTKSGNNYTIKSGSNYLGYKSSTDLSNSTTTYNWTITAGTKGTFRINSATSGRALVYRAGSTNKFGGYATSNISANGTEYYDVELFKLAN